MSGWRARRTSVALSGALLALVLALPGVARAQEIIVYERGRQLEWDEEVGAHLNEVILRAYDCRTHALVRTETVQAYFHLSEDGEVITPGALCAECRRVFDIQERAGKWFFRGVRPARVESPPGGTAPPSDEAVLDDVERRIIEVARHVVAVPPARLGSATERRRLIAEELTAPLEALDDAGLGRMAEALARHPDLTDDQRAYVLRTFGWHFHTIERASSALEFYRRSLRLRPDFHSTSYQTGLSLEETGDHDRALRCYAHALDLSSRAKYAEAMRDLLGRVERTGTLRPEDVSALRALVAALLDAFAAEDDERHEQACAALLARLRRSYGDDLRVSLDG